MAVSAQTVNAQGTAQKKRNTGHLVGNTALVVVVLAWLFPVFWILITSLKTRTDIVTDVPSFIFKPTLENYQSIFGPVYHFEQVVLHSVIICGLATLFCIILAVPTSYSLARFRDSTSNNIALWILSLRYLPPIAVVIPFYILATTFNQIDTYTVMIFIYMAFGLPFAIWLMRGFVQEIPPELDYAAKLDGYGYLDILRRIVIPLTAPSIAVTAIFTFIFSWNEFVMALILTDIKALTVPVAISKMQMAYSVLWGEMSAAGVIAALPLVIVVFALQQYIVRGLTLGAVK
jgi:multiple sugar transport system permease protein